MMMQVDNETLRSLRAFMKEKFGNHMSMFLDTPNSEMSGRTPRQVLAARDHYEVMTLSVLVASSAPTTELESA